MTRKKIALTYITDETTRRTSYRKRKKGILKKVKELSILCGVEAIAIIYSDFDGEEQPRVFPSPEGVQSVIAKFKRYPQVDQHKKMLNQESYMKDRVNRANERLEKARRDNRVLEMTLLMNQCLAQGEILYNNLNIVDLNDLAWVIQEKLNEINESLNALSLDTASSSQSQPNHGVAENQEVAPAAVNEGENRGEEVPEMNMDDTQEVPWYLNLINGGEDQNPFLPLDNLNNDIFK